MVLENELFLYGSSAKMEDSTTNDFSRKAYKIYLDKQKRLIV